MGDPRFVFAATPAAERAAVLEWLHRKAGRLRGWILEADPHDQDRVEIIEAWAAVTCLEASALSIEQGEHLPPRGDADGNG